MRRILLMLLVMTLLFLASCSSPEAQLPAAEPPAAEPPAADASNQEPEIVYVDPEKAVAIYVNDKKIAQSGVCNADQTFLIEIPLLSVLRELGATITWLSEKNATVAYGEQYFTLNIEEEMMYLNDHPVISKIAAGGSSYMPVFRVIGEEVFVDQLGLIGFFNAYTDTPMTWNFAKKEVYIKEGNQWDYQKNNS